ncbi:MAG: cytochrome P450 [Hyphomonadaceae bacterium]|nr:cytochrome P450 [Hyphomonadaceae bacterium]
MARFDFFSQDAKRNPFPALRAVREAGPLVEVNFPIVGKAYLATTWASVGDFLKGHDLFAADARNAGKSNVLGFWWAPRMVRILAQTMLTLDDPDHRRLRKLVDAPFRRDRIEAMRPVVARIADELLDEMEASGDLDLVRGFARELPLRVISEMLGLEAEERQRVTQWMSEFSSVTSIVSVARILQIIGKMMNYFRAEFARRRMDPRPGLVTELVQAEADGDRLSEDELLAMVFLLFIAGHETTTHLISTSVLDLLEHPDQLDLLKSDPSIMSNAVEELHRHNSPVQATKPRMARRDMDFHGVHLKQGDRVFGLLASANADPAHFADPERLDLRRNNVRHAGYGGGMHLCLGMHLARVETEVALERLLKRWPSLSLAVPAGQLRWLPRPGMRGPMTLPLQVAGLRKRSRAA